MQVVYALLTASTYNTKTYLQKSLGAMELGFYNCYEKVNGLFWFFKLKVFCSFRLSIDVRQSGYVSSLFNIKTN